jgi:hypothetical protein
MGWKVRESNRGMDENFSTRPAPPLDPPSLQYNGLCVIPERYIGRIAVLTTHPGLAPNLKKENVVPPGPSWAVLGKFRFLRKLITCTNVVM